MKFEQRKIWAGDVYVSYIDEDNAPGTPVVFIHGFPFDKSMWAPQVEAVRNSHRAIAYDIRGHGNSNPGTQELSIQLFTEDLFLFLDAVGIERAILCGLSMGGYIALNAVHQEPLRVAGLVLCDTQCFADTEEVKEKRMVSIVNIRKDGLKQYASDSLKRLLSPGSQEGNKELVSTIETMILNTPVETICNTLVALAERKETCSTLPLINVPVLIMVGAADQITSVEASQRMQELIPGAALRILKDAGHLSNLENTPDFNLHLEDFLQQLEVDHPVH